MMKGTDSPPRIAPAYASCSPETETEVDHADYTPRDQFSLSVSRADQNFLFRKDHIFHWLYL